MAKRSEVVNTIANWAHPTILDDVYGGSLQEWADNLLYTLETEYGMQPPMTGKMIQDNVVDRWGVDTGRTEIVRVLRYEWEDEDNASMG